MIISMCDSFIKDTVVITNRKLVKGDYLSQLRKVISLKPNSLILREKDLTDDEYEKLALTVIDICKEAKVPFILHQRIDVARRINCKNIQLSVSQLADLKSYIDEFTLISVSCHSLEDVQYAISMGANQIVLGTIFETDCKKGLKGKGLEFVKEICDYCKNNGDVPVYAIGGINPSNIELVINSGARGGCMMSYLMTL